MRWIRRLFDGCSSPPGRFARPSSWMKRFFATAARTPVRSPAAVCLRRSLPDNAARNLEGYVTNLSDLEKLSDSRGVPLSCRDLVPLLSLACACVRLPVGVLRLCSDSGKRRRLVFGGRDFVAHISSIVLFMTKAMLVGFGSRRSRRTIRWGRLLACLLAPQEERAEFAASSGPAGGPPSREPPSPPAREPPVSSELSVLAARARLLALRRMGRSSLRSLAVTIEMGCIPLLASLLRRSLARRLLPRSCLYWRLLRRRFSSQEDANFAASPGVPTGASSSSTVGMTIPSVPCVCYLGVLCALFGCSRRSWIWRVCRAPPLATSSIAVHPLFLDGARDDRAAR